MGDAGEQQQVRYLNERPTRSQSFEAPTGMEVSVSEAVSISDSLPTILLIRTTSGTIEKIQYYRKNEDANIGIWNGSTIVPEIDGEFAKCLKDEVQDLNNESGKLSPQKVARLVEETVDEPGKQFWAERAVDLAGMKDHPPVPPGGPVLFLQQVVFSPIAALLYSFAPSGQYVTADTWAECSHAVLSLKGTTSHGPSLQNVWCKPKGGIAATAAKTYAIAVMEVKPTITIDRQDMITCIIMASMSVLAFETIGTPLPVAVPFILGYNDTAALFVCRLDTKTSDGGAPKVERVYIANMCKSQQRLDFLAHLAVLVARLTRKVKENWIAFKMLAEINDPIGLPSAFPMGWDSWCSPWTESAGSFYSHASTPYGDGDDDGDDDDNGKRPPEQNEMSAKTAAALNGALMDLTYPFPRTRVVDLEDQDSRCGYRSELAFYQQSSPFYFGGFHKMENGDAVPVFCKVWREGDRKTNRAMIEREIEMLHKASLACVPTPALLREFTVMDVCNTSDANSPAFHVLTMQYLLNEPVLKDDIYEYAASLVLAVRTLHTKCNIVHGDVKPENVAWDAIRKQVSLLDFGQAQQEASAQSYGGTRGFKAPEVVSGDHPNSFQSDAYSVGKTLEAVMAHVHIDLATTELLGDRLHLSAVKNVAAGLSKENRSERVTLEEALSILRVADSTRVRSTTEGGNICTVVRSRTAVELSPRKVPRLFFAQHQQNLI